MKLILLALLFQFVPFEEPTIQSYGQLEVAPFVEEIHHSQTTDNHCSCGAVDNGIEGHNPCSCSHWKWNGHAWVHRGNGQYCDCQARPTPIGDDIAWLLVVIGAFALGRFLKVRKNE